MVLNILFVFAALVFPKYGPVGIADPQSGKSFNIYFSAPFTLEFLDYDVRYYILGLDLKPLRFQGGGTGSG